jgi:hypothetical protein
MSLGGFFGLFNFMNIIVLYCSRYCIMVKKFVMNLYYKQQCAIKQPFDSALYYST